MKILYKGNPFDNGSDVEEYLDQLRELYVLG